MDTGDGTQVEERVSGAIHHVMNRGDLREAKFWGDGDRQRFPDTMGEDCGKPVGGCMRFV